MLTLLSCTFHLAPKIEFMAGKKLQDLSNDELLQRRGKLMKVIYTTAAMVILGAVYFGYLLINKAPASNLLLVAVLLSLPSIFSSVLAIMGGQLTTEIKRREENPE